MQELTQARLKELLHYDPETGVFVWVSGELAGIRAGTSRASDYVSIMISGKKYLGHRLAWLFVYGSFPAKIIDHINGAKPDNRIKNLRECSYAQNFWNTNKRVTNKSGFKGVDRFKQMCMWRARITVNGKRKQIGLFDTAKEAGAAYEKEARKLHGEFYREA